MANRTDDQLQREINLALQAIVQVDVETHPPPEFGKETRLMFSVRLSLSMSQPFLVFVMARTSPDVRSRKSGDVRLCIVDFFVTLKEKAQTSHLIVDLEDYQFTDEIALFPPVSGG